MASALTTSPASACARSRARSDLPVAVGPTTATITLPASARPSEVMVRGHGQAAWPAGLARWLEARRCGRSADELVGMLLAAVLVVAEGVLVDTGVPRVARLAPAVAAHGLAGLLRLALVQTVDVERAVEVVVLVLHAACEPTGRVELDPVAVQVVADHVGAIGALEREGLPRHREAALGLLVRVGAVLGD